MIRALFRTFLDIFTVKGILNMMLFGFMALLMTIAGTFIAAFLIWQTEIGGGKEFLQQLTFWNPGVSVDYIDLVRTPFINFLNEITNPDFNEFLGGKELIGNIRISFENIGIVIANFFSSFGHLIMPIKSITGEIMPITEELLGQNMSIYSDGPIEPLVTGTHIILSYMVLYLSAFFSFIFVWNNPLDVIDSKGKYQISHRDMGSMPGTRMRKHKVKWNRKNKKNKDLLE